MQYDVVIVGGGMVGMTLACMLAEKTSLTIAILEAQPHQHPWTAAAYHHRVSAITPLSRRIFQSLHVWDAIQRCRVSPFSQIQVWDAASKGEVTFDSREIAEPVLGYIIENNLIQSALEAAIKKYSQITLVAPVKLASLVEKEDGIELTTDQGQVIQGKLAVGADGGHSWLRQQAGISITQHPYGQSAIVATVSTELPHHAVARQVFLATGPLAFLPLLDEKASSIVWSLPTDEAKQLMEMDEALFQQKLAYAFEYRLGDITELGQRYSYPLIKQQANHYVQSRIALVGDAAHTIHPLAGQGVNMGLLDVVSLVDVLVTAIKQHREMASYATLRRYERWRRADNAVMLAGVDMIKCLFASEKKSVQTMRSLGLNTVDRWSGIKNIFARYAVGDGLLRD